MMYRTTSYAEGAFDIFWYEKNLQGDIIAIYNNAGIKVATYTYTDAWGNHTVSYSNGGASTGAAYNPFRYRGYYYDTDLGMYYLQSRYYDSKVCRFISADYASITAATPYALTDKNLYAYCDNNPVVRVDSDGMFWNFVIGGIVGGVISGTIAGITSYINDGKVDWTSVIINTAVGTISGVVAASGLCVLAQAGISVAVSGVGCFAEQAISKGIDNVDYLDVAATAALSGVSSLVGSAVGKIVGKTWMDQADDLTSMGRDKLLTGVVRRTAGQSHSSYMRQGYKFIEAANLPTNIFRGVSSVVGSFVSGVTTLGYNSYKGWWW